MINLGKAVAGEFCWVDLAATDAGSAKAFYGQLFGWTSSERTVNGGSFTRLQLPGRDIGSLYQLQQDHITDGVPSHWTPYIRVDDLDDTVRRVPLHGGKVLVRPFAVAAFARIALILDSVGAHVGLWEPLEANVKEDAHG